MGSRRTSWVSAGVLILVLVIGTTVLAAPFGSRSLYAGRVGADVAELQRRLNSLGYLAGATDGIFGPRTQSALTSFQEDTGLVTDGMASQWDFQALNRAGAYERAKPHTVQAGENLAKIAAANGTTAETLIWLNQLTEDAVKPGQVIRIPAPEEALPVPPTTAPEPPAPAPGPSPDPAKPEPPAPSPDPVDPVMPPAGGPGTVAQPPAPQEEPSPDGSPQPGHQWVLPSLTPLDYLVLQVPPPSLEEPAPPQTPIPAGHPLVVGYYAEDWQGDPRALASLRQAGDRVDMVVNFQLQIDATGSLSTRHYPELLAEARQRGVQVYGLVHNFHGSGFSKDVARAVLSSPDVRRRAVEQMLTACKTFGLAGIDVDIENVPADQRSNYTALIKELSERLKPEGYGVTISIPAKTFDDKRSSWSGAFDYAALGLYADKVAIMAYDESTPGFPAGPVASLGWVEKVAAFASSQMDPKKVLLGIAGYGYDWVAGTTRARGLSSPQAEALAARHGAAIQWDDQAQVPYFTYWDQGTERIVYFENAASTAPKLDLVAKYGLGGIAIWRLGLEDPGIWPVIQEKLR